MAATTHALAATLALGAACTASPPRGYDIIPPWDQPVYQEYCYPAPHHPVGVRPYARRYPLHLGDPYAYRPLAPYPYAGACSPYAGGYDTYRRSAVHTVYGEISTLPPPKSYDEVVGEAGVAQPESDGWRFLADGDARHAMASFIEAAKQPGEDAGPKVGYALAAAELGDETTAIWAMRRAFRFDAPGARYLPLDAELRQVINDHRMYFEYDSECLAADAWFMVAALRLITHQDAEAEDAVQRARTMGDRSYELRRLERELRRDAPIGEERADAGDEEPAEPDGD